MSIKGITDKPSFPRMGKLHLGIKREGVPYPEPIDYFLVKEDMSTSKESNEAFHAVYGEKPTSLDIIFPFNTLDDIFPQWWKRYAKRGHGGVLICRGDGEVSSTLNEQTGEWLKGENCENCAHVKEGKCKKVGNLKFMLPYVKGGGIWQIDTGSYNSIRNLNGTIYMAIAYAQLAQRPMTEIPCKLIVQMQDIPYKYAGDDGQMRTGTRKLPIMSIIISESLVDIIKKKQTVRQLEGPSAETLPPPAKEDLEVPEDLVPPETLDKNEKIDTAADDLGAFFEQEGKALNLTEEFDKMVKQINDATVMETLKAVAKEIGSKGFQKEHMQKLSAAYNAKAKDLTVI